MYLTVFISVLLLLGLTYYYERELNALAETLRLTLGTLRAKVAELEVADALIEQLSTPADVSSAPIAPVLKLFKGDGPDILDGEPPFNLVQSED